MKKTDKPKIDKKGVKGVKTDKKDKKDASATDKKEGAKDATFPTKDLAEQAEQPPLNQPKVDVTEISFPGLQEPTKNLAEPPTPKQEECKEDEPKAPVLQEQEPVLQEQEPKLEVAVNEEPINAAWAINLALHYKNDIAESNISPDIIEKEVYGSGGIMENLKSFRPKLPSDKLEEFDQILATIESLVKGKLAPAAPATAEPVSATPAATTAPPAKVSAKERLEAEFEKVSNALKEFKATRVCHPQHVIDFCKQSSYSGFNFTYDSAEHKLNGSFLGEKISCDFVA